MQQYLRQHWPKALILILLSWRFLHFGETLDLPHDWRQADTAYYIWDFYQNGIDLFEPAVCWMGAAETVILEFPLPEAIVAQMQLWFGESMLLSRMLFFSFFLFCCFYFFRIVQLLWNEEVATFALLFYVSLPLSQYYSRAIHIDFFTQAFAFGVFYHCLAAIQQRSFRQLIWASGLAVIAFLVKVPYAFLLAFPILAYAYRQKAIRWLLLRSFVFIVPVGLFWWWQQYVHQINSQAPDWSYILNYRKFDENASWYFGTISQRLSPYPWKVITLRVLFEAGGVLALAILPWLKSPRQLSDAEATLLAWLFGLAVYILLFFNLNVFHNYYQIPFLGPVAILLAIGLLGIRDRWGINYSFAVALSFAILCTAYAEWKYYEVPEELDIIAASIERSVPPEGLPIVVYQDFDCRNPRILGRAKRRGWSLEETAASAEVVERLYKEEGATHLIVVEAKPKLSIALVDAFKLKDMKNISAQALSDYGLNIITYQFP